MVLEVIAHHSLEWIQQQQRREKDVFRARNLPIMLLAMKGWTAHAIGEAVGLTRRVVQTRVAAFNQQDLWILLTKFNTDGKSFA